MRTPETQLRTPEKAQSMTDELFRPLDLDPATGDPLGYPGLSAAIERRLVPLMKSCFVSDPGLIDDLLTLFTEDGLNARNRVRSLLLMAAGTLAVRHRRITRADMRTLLTAAGETLLETAEGRRVEQYKVLLARLIIRGVMRRGEVRRANS